ncbi:DNA (cytosine-5-)-methyltransferase [Parasporobacterium paucivorans]|uniref:Cytosine-specific methyltransferase n=1 Tax=Parasporobacterium paucivorans DSM 15970 TaxID=1122934 RepID=A0A1M6LMF9_9FIRM|nr:DNA (cytosine-5-)-methyltransferase [Parasporobacterium paucivorans]SHJ72363.1 DNA (cytosine-5)-methyltransferase 1 [Parasporobacterium paucivorans DSM 15970]
MIDKTICELFAGVGGFRLGLEHSSKEWNTVWANQWEPGKKSQHAFDCYCHHFGRNENHVNEDISSVDKSIIPDHSLLVGGFPCQDYSVARTGAKGISGVKGVLWWEIRDILETKRPKFVLLENVDRLLKSPSTQRGRDFGIILACFHQLGYSVEWRVINAAEYGFAQRRRRTFIFAYQNDTSYGQRRSVSTPQCIINTNGFFAKTFPIEATDSFRISALEYTELADISDRFKFDFENAGYMTDGNITTSSVVPIQEKPITIRQIIDSNADKKFYLGDNLEKWTYLKGSKKIERTSKTGHTYTFSEGPIAFPDPIDKPARTMLTSESSLNRSTHVILDPNTNKLRLITPLEAERIQGFEDNWTDTGMPEKFRYFCMGNALVVGVVERMGHTLNKIFAKEVHIEYINDNTDEKREAI